MKPSVARIGLVLGACAALIVCVFELRGIRRDGRIAAEAGAASPPSATAKAS